MTTANTLQKLTITDDYMFRRVFGDKVICQRFLEELLPSKVTDLRFKDLSISSEKVIEGNPTQKGVRLDVSLQGTDTLIDVEMQAVNHKGLTKRIRYYQSMLDSITLGRGEDYSKLRLTCIIFICDFDAFSKGCPVYRKTSQLVDLYTNEVVDSYKDGSHIYILNSHFENSPVQNEITKFLQYVRTGEVIGDSSNSLAGMIARRVEAIKANSNESEVFKMYEESVRQESYTRGKKDGVQEGKAQEKNITIQKLSKKYTPQQIAEDLELPLEYVLNILSSKKDTLSAMNLS